MTNALYTHRYNQQYLFVSENTLAINHLYSRLFLSAIACVAKENRFPLSSCETDLCSANSFSLSGVIVSPLSFRAKQFHNRTFPNIFYGDCIETDEVLVFFQAESFPKSAVSTIVPSKIYLSQDCISLGSVIFFPRTKSFSPLYHVASLRL